jgi:hypothetical protein
LASFVVSVSLTMSRRRRTLVFIAVPCPINGVAGCGCYKVS